MFKTVSRLAAAAVIVGSVFAASNSALAASSLLSVVSRDNNEYDIVITKDSVGINMLQVVLNCAASEDAVFKADAADWGEFKQNRKPDQLGFMISSTGTVGAGNANKVLRAGMAVASVKCAKAPAITFKDSWQNTGVGFATMQSITDTGIETHVMCVDISKSSVNSVKSGDTFTLSADIYPTAAKVKDIVWSSSAPEGLS